MDDGRRIVLVSTGNTRTRFAASRDGRVDPSRVLPNTDPAAIVAGILESAGQEEGPLTVALASVNDPIAGKVEAGLVKAGFSVVRFGPDLPVPIVMNLENTQTVGQDRLLDALGAFARSKQACIVIDAGTAVTVDFVDGEGTFHGGAIAPGLGMMLKALHEQTAALPLVDLASFRLPGSEPGDPPFGKSTPQAIALGVVSAVRGLVHELVDKYAEFYEAYPRVVATGGDAPLLFESDSIVEHIVPDLTLIGMAAALQRLDELDEHSSASDGERPQEE